MRWPDTKIVMMTGSRQDDAQSRTDACPVDTWLFKPFGLKEIRRMMDGFESM